jgi:hypothetical protein
MMGGFMLHALAGFVSGAISGAIMGLVSHLFFRLGVFKSSLIIVDGSFFVRTLSLRDNPFLVAALGLSIHLVTSGVFGAFYVVAASFAGLDAVTIKSFLSIGLYVTLLWISMLFVALPIAGEGVLGRRSGPLSWLEQLFLHMVFSGFYYGCLLILL